LRYGQVVKERNEQHRLVGVSKQIIFGDISLSTISTAYIERQNLTLRHENKRLTRKTIAFSKESDWLKYQLMFYQSFYNLCRPHRGLAVRLREDEGNNQPQRRWNKVTPAMKAGLTNHIWTVQELLTTRIYQPN